jgi:hypothetical protein
MSMPSIFAISRALGVFCLYGLGFILVGCTILPHPTPLVTLREELAKVPMERSGVIAFVPVSNSSPDLYMDLYHIDSAKTYRVILNPQIGGRRFEGFSKPVRRPDSLVFKGWIHRKVALYALPAGRLIPVYKGYVVDSKNMSATRAESDTLFLKPDRINSLGFLGSRLTEEFWVMPQVTVTVLGSNIDTILGNTADSGLSHRSIQRIPFRL